MRLLDCAGLCGPAISVGLPAASPAATRPFSCCTNGQPDPQIAASNSYLVIGNRDTVWFYDKAGKQLYTKAAGPSSEQSVHGAISNKSYPYTVPLCKLFKPLIPQMNAALDSTLPHQLGDPDGNAINVQNGYGLNCDTATGGVRPDNWSLPTVPNDDSTDGLLSPVQHDLRRPGALGRVPRAGHEQRLKEYGEQNNAIYVPLPKRRGR